MNRRTILAGLASLALLACGSGTPTGNTPAGDVLVGNGNNSFSPATLSVQAGKTVTWAWNANGVSHNVTFDDGPQSDTQSSGSFTRTFPTAGTFPYHCTIHGAAVMSGTITVTTASGTTGTGTGGGSGGGGATNGGYSGAM